MQTRIPFTLVYYLLYILVDILHFRPLKIKTGVYLLTMSYMRELCNNYYQGLEFVEFIGCRPLNNLFNTI